MPVLSRKGYRVKVFTKTNKKRPDRAFSEMQKRQAIRLARAWVRAWAQLDGAGPSASVSIDERDGALIYQCHAVSKNGKLELRGDEL